MGRALLSAFIHDLLDNLATSQTKDFLKQFKYLHRLKAALLSLDALVDEAEEKQFSIGGDAVKRWLNDVQHSLYYLQQLLGEIAAKSLGRKLQLKHEIRRVFLSKKPHPEAKETKVNVHNMIESLEALAKQKDALGLTEGVICKGVRESLQELPPCSLVLDNYFYGNHPKDYFYGREEEEKSILESLLSNRESSGNIKVINIMGTPGAGKTGFADVIYFNHKVREYFEVRAWVNVPYRASVSSVAKKILEAMSQEFIPSNDFDLLRIRLQDFLAGKKFLIVLDDCRIEDDSLLENWNILINSLEVAARGSAIILTANPDEDPLLVPPAKTLHLEFLSQENCWSIFLVHAFGQRDIHKFPELEAVGKEIVNRLGNLPLAAKMVGSLLQDKPHLWQWVQILRSKLLNASEDSLPIPPFLILCYLDLPAELKRCFAYLSLFPKGYQCKPKEVVPLWMAQGFLHQQSKSSGKSMEEIGDEYFGYLIMRSFLQPLGAGVSFIMHNLVHDLAIYIFGESSKHHLSHSTSIEDFPEISLNQQAHLLRTILPIHFPLERAPWQLQTSVLEKAFFNLNPQIFHVLSLSNEILMRKVAKIPSHASLRRVQMSHELQEFTPQSYSGFASTKYTLTSSASEIEEIAHESTTTRLLPPDPASSDAPRIPNLKELSSGLLSSQVEVHVPDTNEEILLQSSLAQVGTSINKQAPVPLVTDALKTATDTKIETSTLEDSDDQRSSFEMLKVSNISQLKRLPPKLQSLKIEGCESIEALPDGFSSEIPTLQELYLINCSSLKSYPYPASLRTLYIHMETELLLLTQPRQQ
ncbi:hypothetical protein L6164_017913 [Bauhinia variegata]|uniref:Uncharacterized protein n=1 Tax=Bauhinia variegata TaxID=167791 RepID=A0ACB9NA59_BAUVA|nr:hypothetical protein L6164_017913 [Bauhinia variegata]